MSDQETFLARWSRRKQAAAEPTRADPSAAQSSAEQRIAGTATVGGAEAPSGTHKEGVASAASPDAIAPLFDVASLPAIESIVAETDIRGFLAPGVPPELTRAALRRAWAADPMIRDFVGLADYDWDFNAPGSMVGFGPLEMTEELRQIAARIIGHPAEPSADPAESSEISGRDGSRDDSAESVHETSKHKADAGDPSRGGDQRIAAAHNPLDAAEKSQLVVRPRH
jgi:Protein of unknown function (DUF3306)